MVLIFSGERQTALHPATAASSRASMSLYVRFDPWCCRRDSHNRSTGFHSGEYAGKVTNVRFAGVRSDVRAEWYPAPSHTRTACVPTGMVADSWSRNACTTLAFRTAGRGADGGPDVEVAVAVQRRLRTRELEPGDENGSKADEIRSERLQKPKIDCCRKPWPAIAL